MREAVCFRGYQARFRVPENIVDQVSVVRGHWLTETVLSNALIVWSPEIFRVAPARDGVREWLVSSEPALRRRPGDAESADADASSARVARMRPKLDEGPRFDQGAALSLRFEDVFRQYAPYVAALVLKLIGRPGDVDDVVQDIFIQVHRGLCTLRSSDAVRPWLRRITVRRSRRWLRKRWVLSWFRESELDSTAELVDPSASPEDRALVATVYRALERLPRDERLVWVLRIVEGETLESIADLLGCSVSTVQRRLRAAQAAMGAIR
jgi:RNA polymerase sigma-70 factor (ECF subfamily)